MPRKLLHEYIKGKKKKKKKGTLAPIMGDVLYCGDTEGVRFVRGSEALR